MSVINSNCCRFLTIKGESTYNDITILIQIICKIIYFLEDIKDTIMCIYLKQRQKRQNDKICLLYTYLRRLKREI